LLTVIFDQKPNFQARLE